MGGNNAKRKDESEEGREWGRARGRNGGKKGGREEGTDGERVEREGGEG